MDAIKKIGTLVITGFFVAVVAAIVFVKAGASGESGGKQTADILGGFGDLAAKTANALEGNAA